MCTGSTGIAALRFQHDESDQMLINGYQPMNIKIDIDEK
jgi:hypothetical protein